MIKLQKKVNAKVLLILYHVPFWQIRFGNLFKLYWVSFLNELETFLNFTRTRTKVYDFVISLKPISSYFAVSTTFQCF